MALSVFMSSPGLGCPCKIVAIATSDLPFQSPGARCEHLQSRWQQCFHGSAAVPTGGDVVLNVDNGQCRNKKSLAGPVYAVQRRDSRQLLELPRLTRLSSA